MTNLHPRAKTLFFFQNFFVLLAMFIGGLMAVFAGNGSVLNEIGIDPNIINMWLVFWIGVVIIATLSWLFAWLTYINYRYDLGERGFQKESGIIWKRYVTIPYARIQNIDIHRGLIARILGLSDIMIQTAGHSSSQVSLSEGRLPAIGKQEAVALRDDLIKRVTEPTAKQGL